MPPTMNPMAQAGMPAIPGFPPGIPGFPGLPQGAGFPPIPGMAMFNPHAMQAMAGAFQAMSGVATTVASPGLFSQLYVLYKNLYGV